MIGKCFLERNCEGGRMNSMLQTLTINFGEYVLLNLTRRWLWSISRFFRIRWFTRWIGGGI